MRCPSCRHEMIAMEFKAVEVDYCPSCGGCWLDHGELELLLGGEAQAATTQTSRRRGRRPCPHCRKRMHAGPLDRTPIEVDVCARHGLWLDRGELQAVIQARSSSAETSALAAYCQEVFGS